MKQGMFKKVYQDSYELSVPECKSWYLRLAKNDNNHTQRYSGLKFMLLVCAQYSTKAQRYLNMKNHVSHTERCLEQKHLIPSSKMTLLLSQRHRALASIFVETNWHSVDNVVNITLIVFTFPGIFPGTHFKPGQSGSPDNCFFNQFSLTKWWQSCRTCSEVGFGVSNICKWQSQ